MNYAVILTGGKQYKVSPGDVLDVEHLASDNGEVTFDKVLLYSQDGDVQVGMPYIADISVHGKVLADLKGPKIHVSKFLAKSRYRRKTGHRQSLSKIEIQDIVLNGKSTEAVSAPRKTASKKKA